MQTSKKSFKFEIAICLALLVLILVVWTQFVTFLYNNLSVFAAFAFIRHHRSLGEDPKFILDTAVNGLPQPFEIILTWREFQFSVIITLLLIFGLGWLMFRLWRA